MRQVSNTDPSDFVDGQTLFSDAFRAIMTLRTTCHVPPLVTRFLVRRCHHCFILSMLHDITHFWTCNMTTWCRENTNFSSLCWMSGSDMFRLDSNNRSGIIRNTKSMPIMALRTICMPDYAAHHQTNKAAGDFRICRAYSTRGTCFGKSLVFLLF
jgi:hypothetical protein